MQNLARSVGLDEAALRRLLDDIPVGIGVAEPVETDGSIKPDARIVYYNKHWVKMFGFDVDDVITVEGATRRLYPDADLHAQRIRSRQEAAARRRAGGGEQTEARAMGANGQWVDVLTGTSVVGDRLIVTMLDIGEEKKAANEHAKAEAEATMRERIILAARAAKSAFWEWDLATNVVKWSPEMMDLFGIGNEKRYANLDVWSIWRERLHPADLPAAERDAMAAFHARAPLATEYRIIKPDGTICWMESRGDVIRDEKGQAVRMAGINTDITARKNAEQNAAEYRAQLEQLLAERTTELDTARRRLEKTAYEVTENIPVGTYVLESDPHGHAQFTFTSERWLRMLDLCRKDVMADPSLAFRAVHPDDQAEFLRLNEQVIANKEPLYWEGRIVVRGETRWVTIESVPRNHPDGGTIWEGVMVDITERKLAEEKIRESVKRMQLAAAAAGIGFWSRDNATGIEGWDDEMLRIYGIRREEFDGRWESCVHPEDLGKVQRLTEEALAAGTIGRYEYRIIRPDGAVRHIRGMSTSVRGLRGQPLLEIGVNFDITAEKQAAEREKQLAKQHRRDLEQKLKTSLTAAAVAHEINQPLSAILIDSQMALARIQGDSRELAQARAFLSSTISNAERTVATIGKMMSLLRSVQTKPHEVNLVNVLRSAELYAKDDLRAAGITLRIEGAGRAVKIRGDEGQLVLAVSNLIRNAIEAIRSGHTGRSPEILIRLARDGKSIVLSVSDSGPGLPRETLAKIPLHTTKPQGTGLGLFIVKTVAENHGAKLQARQSVLGGAELRLLFPVEEKFVAAV